LDFEERHHKMRSRTQLDRYPAKMVSRLADGLVDKYAHSATRVLDPFCGSGAVLVSAAKKAIPATGIDINPVASLLSEVKINGFSPEVAKEKASQLIALAGRTDPLPMQWVSKDYWFTPLTLHKFERLRAAAKVLKLHEDRDGIAVLLSMCLAVRLCSRADQRSPKPFISKDAISVRKGRHFDPYKTTVSVLDDLSQVSTAPHCSATSRFILANIASAKFPVEQVGNHSHVITSPPYINAQDYFRNFKLELYVLEGVLPFTVESLTTKFIGTERGNLLAGIEEDEIESHFDLLPNLRSLDKHAARLGAVVHRYISDMNRAFVNMKEMLESGACVVLVCGDNLVGGMSIKTWRVLKQMLESQGFTMFDMFTDQIANRMLATKRAGHKGLIKEEVVCAFKRCV
jgi:hypothetical protein